MAFIISKIMPHSSHAPLAHPRVLGETLLVGPFRFQTVVRLETCTVTVTESCTSNPHRELRQNQVEFIQLVKSKLNKKTAATAAWRPESAVSGTDTAAIIAAINGLKSELEAVKAAANPTK